MRAKLTDLLVFLTALAAPTAAAQGSGALNKLEGDYLGMAEIRRGDPGSPAQLYVFEADRSVPKRRRWIEIFDKRTDKITKSPSVALPDDVAAFDVCRLSAVPTNPESLLLIRKNGVYLSGQAKPIAAIPTLFPHARDDLLPRIRLCFDLFKGEAPALVVPQLQGVVVFRQSKPGVYTEHATLDVDAELGFQGQVLRGEDTRGIQRISARFQFPDVSAHDFDGDGLLDLCFSAEEVLTCRLQEPGKGFSGAMAVKHHFEARKPEERQDTSLRITSRLVDMSGDGRPDFVIGKSTWNVSDMKGSLHIYAQGADGSFPKVPTQTMERQGYFAYHEFLDYDGDGLRDVIAPVASLGWTDLARIYLSRSADIEFVWFRNVGGKLETSARTIHSLSFPVEFKNIAAILGSLPIWDVRLKPRSEASAKQRQVLFFPKKAALELRAVTEKGVSEALWQTPARLGSDTIVVDLDGNGLQEIVSAYPRDQERSSSLLFVETPSIK